MVSVLVTFPLFRLASYYAGTRGEVGTAMLVRTKGVRNVTRPMHQNLIQPNVIQPFHTIQPVLFTIAPLHLFYHIIISILHYPYSHSTLSLHPFYPIPTADVTLSLRLQLPNPYTYTTYYPIPTLNNSLSLLLLILCPNI